VAAERLWTAAQVDPQESAAALQNQAVVSYRQGRESRALQQLQGAFDIAMGRHDLDACAAILTNLSHLERQRGRWSIADECLALAERIEQEASRPRSTLRVQAFRRELVRGLAMLAADPHGRNRGVGMRLGQGESLPQILASMAAVAEGVNTSRSVCDLSRKLGIDMPITNVVFRVLFEGLSPREATDALMRRPVRDE